jgi:hypothetical protein
MTTFVRLSIATALALGSLARASSAQPSPPAPASSAGTLTAPPGPPDGAPGTPATPPLVDPFPPEPPPAPAGEPATSPSAPVTSPSGPGDATLARGVEWTSLRLLRAKGVISDAEYDAALRDMSGITGGADAATLVVSKLQLTLFGYAQADFKYDSTQSCLDLCGALPIQKRGTYRGDHGRLIFSPRGSRFGVRFAAQKARGVRLSGLLETDFLGSGPGLGANDATTEQDLWSSPVLRLRQAWIKVETPIVDVLLGQTGNLFGWASAYLVTGSQQPGFPAQMYQRTSQLKLSRSFRYFGFTADVAVAVERPPQQDSAVPELVAGARLAWDRWTGYHTFALAGSVLQPASIAVTVDHRRFAIAELSAAPRRALRRTGGGVAINAFLPILRATRDSHDHALAISAERVSGEGISDMYTGLGAAGTINPPVPPAMPGDMPGTYTPNFDPGLAAYDQLGNLELIQWASYIVGLEYYPGGFGGRLGAWVNYGHMQSANSYRFGGSDAVVNDPVLGRTREKEDFVDAGLFFDPTPSTRVGSGFAYYRERYVDGAVAKSYSVMSSAFLFF